MAVTLAQIDAIDQQIQQLQVDYTTARSNYLKTIQHLREISPQEEQLWLAESYDWEHVQQPAAKNACINAQTYPNQSQLAAETTAYNTARYNRQQQVITAAMRAPGHVWTPAEQAYYDAQMAQFDATYNRPLYHQQVAATNAADTCFANWLAAHPDPWYAEQAEDEALYQQLRAQWEDAHLPPVQAQIDALSQQRIELVNQYNAQRAGSAPVAPAPAPANSSYTGNSAYTPNYAVSTPAPPAGPAGASVTGWIPVYGPASPGSDSHSVDSRVLVGYMAPVEGTGGWTTQKVSVSRAVPAQPYLPPTPPVAAEAGYLEMSYNFGWNATDRSIDFLIDNGFVEFRPPASNIDLFAGLAPLSGDRTYRKIDAAFRVSHGKVTPFLHGVALPISSMATTFTYTNGAVYFTDGPDTIRLVLLRLKLRGTHVIFEADYDDGVSTWTEVLNSGETTAKPPLYLTVCAYSAGDEIDMAAIGYLPQGAAVELRSLAAFGLGDPVRDFKEGSAAVLEYMFSHGGISDTMVGEGAHLVLQRLTSSGWTAAVRGYARSQVVLEPLFMSSYVPSRSEGVLPYLATLGSDRPYGQALLVLEPLTTLGYAGLLQTEYGIGDGVLPFLYVAATGLSGEVGNASLSLQLMDTLGSGTLYPPVSHSYGVLPFMFSHGGISDEMVGEGSAVVLEFLRPGVEYSYGGRIYGESMAELPLMTAFGSAYEGNNFAAPMEFMLAADPWFVFNELTADLISTVQISDNFLYRLLIRGNLPCEVMIATDATGLVNYVVMMLTSVTANFGVPAFFGGATTWVQNVVTKATSEYEGFDFNSYGTIDGEAYGCRADGLYRLTGSDDAGTPIAASINFGRSNYNISELKGVKNAYVGLSSTGQLVLKVSYEGHEYLYVARGYSETRQVQRFDTGRGIRANYLQFELYNRDGADFDIDSVEFTIIPLNRRI